MPKRERYVWVCTNRRPDGHPKGSCAEKGSEAFQAALKAAIAEKGLHKRVRVMTSSCQDLCWVGSTAAVLPEGVFLKNLSEAAIPRLLEALGDARPLTEAGELEALFVKDGEFEEPRPLVSLGRRAEKT